MLGTRFSGREVLSLSPETVNMILDFQGAVTLNIESLCPSLKTQLLHQHEIFHRELSLQAFRHSDVTVNDGD